MKFGHFLKALAPVLAVALAAGVAGCDKATIKINGEEGKKLADLDLSGKAPDRSMSNRATSWRSPSTAIPMRWRRCDLP
jgi:hypothetical protein